MIDWENSMSHDHAHHHHDESYYLDQLCTVAASGLLGAIALVLWRTDTLIEYNILKNDFRIWTLLGGIALVAMAVVRGVALWTEVGRKKSAHAHDHEHGESCGHDHGASCSQDHGDAHDHGHHHAHNHDHGHDHAHDHDHGHDHDHDHSHGHDHSRSDDHAHHRGELQSLAHDEHGHDHSFAPWRYGVLLMPLLLACLLIYYHFQGWVLRYSDEILFRGATNETELTDSGSAAASGEHEKVNLFFQELNLAAPNPAKRAYFEGKLGTLDGLFNPITDRQFSLMRWKMTCCGADAVPLKVRIISPESLEKFEPRKGVKVTGVVEFRKLDSGEYIPVMRLRSLNDIERVELGNKIYE